MKNIRKLIITIFMGTVLFFTKESLGFAIEPEPGITTYTSLESAFKSSQLGTPQVIKYEAYNVKKVNNKKSTENYKAVLKYNLKVLALIEDYSDETTYMYKGSSVTITKSESETKTISYAKQISMQYEKTYKKNISLGANIDVLSIGTSAESSFSFSYVDTTTNEVSYSTTKGYDISKSIVVPETGLYRYMVN